MKKTLLNNHISDYLFLTLSDIISNEEYTQREKLLHLKKLLSEIIHLLTADEMQYFSNVFARIAFLFDKYRDNRKLNSNVRKVSYYLNTLSRKFYEIDEYIPLNIAELLRQLINEFAQKTNNKKFTHKLDLSFLADEQPLEKSEIIEKITAVVDEVNINDASIQMTAVDDGTIIFKPGKEWSELLHQVRKGNILNLINIVLKDKYYTTNFNTFIVIEPDYLYDASEISGSFYNSGFIPEYFVYQKLTRSSPNVKMIIGNIINYLFDALLFNSDESFDETYIKALKYRPLQVFAIAKLDPEAKLLMRNTARNHFDNLRIIVEIYRDKLKSIEPHFISPLFGFQGRLDLMLEYIGDNARKDVVELKSGKAPSIDEKYFSKGNVFKTGLYLGHLAQATIYNLLLDSTFKNRTGASQILYSSDRKNPLRNAPNVRQIKLEMIKSRNRAFSFEQKLCDTENLVKLLTLNVTDNIPPWVRSDISQFANNFKSLNSIEAKYFIHWFRFIYNELFAGKLGNNSEVFGHSNLWKSSVEEKKLNNSVISGLKIDIGKSDFEKMHLWFNIEDSELQMYPFRKGDLCIIYPDDEDNDFNPRKGRLIKAAIKDLTNDAVIITLRNKLEFNIFRNLNQRWVLDSDYTDASVKSLFASLNSFIFSAPEKKSVILGQTEPRFNDELSVTYDYLSEQQNRILNSALNSQDYYLIQGPPGTGKTSFLLRALTEALYFNTDKNILIIAYTNRAVDEICMALSRINFPSMSNRVFPEFVRLGNKDSTPYKQYLLSDLIEENDINIAYKEFDGTRIVISTSSFILSNPEILNLKSFDTGIIDEASQIIEVNLVGILSKVNRFIMIGDEKQLPAIVSQDSRKTIVKDDELIRIGLKDLSCSLFERLLDTCRINDWNHAHEMLEYQARMHLDLMELSNDLFYDQRLKIMGYDWQNSSKSIFSVKSKNKTSDTFHTLTKLIDKRFIFIDVPAEIHSKYNLTEANITVYLVNGIKEKYGKEFNENSIGVISPFRMQCSLIFKSLDDELRSLITIDTVEKFQGSERDVIIFSAATNNHYLLSKIQSVSEVDGRLIDKKLNVSITRARTHLIMLGSSEILNENQFYKYLINHARKTEAYLKM
jgi:DNA replication ATP-dependent helicase Dna2